MYSLFVHSTNSGNTSDLFPVMSPRTLDSLMHNEPEANSGHLGESALLNHSLALQSKGLSFKYSPSVDPQKDWNPPYDEAFFYDPH